MIWYKSVLLFGLIISHFCGDFVFCDSEGYPTIAAKYCGPVLSDMLSILCKGYYNGKKSKKTLYDFDSDENYEYDQGYQKENQLSYPFKSHSNAAALLAGSFKRYVRGVYDECCVRKCTISEMMGYCGKSSA